MTKTIQCRRYGLCTYDETNTDRHVICNEAFSICYGDDQRPETLDLTVSTGPLDGGIKIIVEGRYLPDGIAEVIGVSVLDLYMWSGEFYMRAEGLKPLGHTLHWEWINPRIEC